MKRWIAVSVAILLVLAAALCGCASTAGWYTEEEHLARIEERARKRFLKEGSEYTDLEVFPIYDQNEEFCYALIELQPAGYMYVYISQGIPLSFLGLAGMYVMSDHEPTDWTPYRVKEGAHAEWEDEWGPNSMEDAELFYDEEGNSVHYSQSHFAVAGIEDEKRYFLLTPIGPITSSDKNRITYTTIPAVKRGEQYLDLVDGALIDYEPDVYYPQYATQGILFINSSAFNL